VNEPINLSSEGPPETVLPTGNPSITLAIAAAATDLDELASIVARDPTSLDAWAAFGAFAEAAAASTAEVITAYAAYRVGYHRGLDLLRKSGWRGSGYVRWSRESNRGFLRCLSGLGRLAARIGEQPEHERVQEFLRQLDPEWPPEGHE